MNPSPITLDNGRGFDNNAVVILSPDQIVSAENADTSTHDFLIPMMAGAGAYHYDAPGMFLVHQRYVRVRQGSSQAIRVRAERVEGHEGAERESAYQIVPEKGVGREQVVLARRLVQVRFQPGDWAWYSPLPIEQEESGGDGDESHRMNDEINGQQKDKERALIIGADVVGMRRVYRIHLVNSHCDMPVVPDERLEEVVREDEDMFL